MRSLIFLFLFLLNSAGKEDYTFNKTGSRVGSYSRSILAGPSVAAEPQVFSQASFLHRLWESESDCATSQAHRLVLVSLPPKEQTSLAVQFPSDIKPEDICGGGTGRVDLLLFYTL